MSKANCSSSRQFRFTPTCEKAGGPHLLMPQAGNRNRLYEFFVAEARKQVQKVETGQISAMMDG